MSWTVLYAIDLCSIALFAISYYRTCYRRGYRIDFWHAQLLLICVLPNMIMFPFAGSPLNAPIVGRDFAGITAALPLIFLLTTVGFLSMLAGGMLWRIRIGIGIRRIALEILEIGPRCSMMLMSSRDLLVFQTLVCFLLQIVILSIYFGHNGLGFNLREYTFANPTLRPIAQTISFSSVIIGSHALARYVEKKETALILCTLLLSVGILFFGSRGSLIAIYLNVFFCYLIKLGDKISLFRIAMILGGGILFALYLGNVRAGEYSLGQFLSLLIVLAFYGNNFSDLRDFAWVYANWNHSFWLGRTYLAGLTAFVPRFASEFRDTWGIGVATGSTIGVDPHEHPGLRPGSFGEAYFNFGWAGVVAVGLLLGVILRRIDIDVKRALRTNNPSMMRSFASTTLTSVAGCVSISANLSALYVLIAIYMLTSLALRFIRLLGNRTHTTDYAG